LESDDPGGFKLYPLALQLIQSSLAELDRKKVAYRIEGFMWHQERTICSARSSSRTTARTEELPGGMAA